MKLELELPQGVLVEQVIEQVSEVIWEVVRGFVAPGQPEWMLYGGIGRAVRERFVGHMGPMQSEPGGGRILLMAGPPRMDLTVFCLVLTHEVLEPIEDALLADSVPELAAEMPDAIEAALTPYLLRRAADRLGEIRKREILLPRPEIRHATPERRLP